MTRMCVLLTWPALTLQVMPGHHGGEYVTRLWSTGLSLSESLAASVFGVRARAFCLLHI